MIHSDFGLAQRLEATEMMLNAAAVERESQLRPATGATQLEVAGGRVFFMGADSPLTQSIGVGMHGPVSGDQLARVEDFFGSRNAPCNLEVCPLAETSLMEMLATRGYYPIEFTSALYYSLEGTPTVPGGVEARPAKPEETDLCVQLIVEGFFGTHAPPGMFELCSVMAGTPLAELFVARDGETAIAGGVLGIWNRVACCAGDATPERFRGRGGQAALIHARLVAARRAGCDLAMAYTMCGSTSQRNYERAGFRIAYTRTKWYRPLAS